MKQAMKVAQGPQQDKDAIIAAGLVPLLAAFLKYQPDAWKQATLALGGLAVGSQQSKDTIIAEGTVPQLVALLRSDQPFIDRTAAVASHTLVALTTVCQQSRDVVSGVS